MGKMPKKKGKTIVPIENDHKEPKLASEAETFDSKRDGLEGEALEDDFEKESLKF